MLRGTDKEEEHEAPMPEGPERTQEPDDFPNAPHSRPEKTQAPDNFPNAAPLPTREAPKGDPVPNPSQVSNGHALSGKLFGNIMSADKYAALGDQDIHVYSPVHKRGDTTINHPPTIANKSAINIVFGHLHAHGANDDMALMAFNQHRRDAFSPYPSPPLYESPSPEMTKDTRCCPEKGVMIKFLKEKLHEYEEEKIMLRTRLDRCELEKMVLEDKLARQNQLVLPIGYDEKPMDSNFNIPNQIRAGLRSRS
ncbi:hypothetical protein G7Y89_g13811 [Cudoniella acicularis]|uniref:Uncharacterized protein n=1 Tax=Cudoniella acicularis TaxID=354080 RepID=A0A8H4R6R8_9HELO|nr:hypothetical protein G7Y89_g13811 [Cudoniella acicularis]